MVRRLFGTVPWLVLFTSNFAMGQVDEKADTSPAGVTAEASKEGDHASDADEAKRAFEEGLEFLHQEAWADAEGAFRRSLAIVPRDSARYDLAYVLFKRGRIRESLSILNSLLDQHDGGDPRYADYAKTLMPHVLGRLATLRLHARPADAALSIDGEAVAASGPERAVLLDPGEHVAELSAPASKAERFTFAAAPGAVVERSVSLVRSGNPERTRDPGVRRDANDGARSGLHSVGPWVTMGVGGALLVGGVIAGILARQADADFTAQCPSLRNCSPSLRDTRDRALAFGHASDVLLVSGAVITSGGIAWRIFAPSPLSGRSHSERAVFVGLSGTY